MLNLGSMRQTSIGRWTIGVSIALGVVGLLFTGMCIVVMEIGRAHV